MSEKNAATSKGEKASEGKQAVKKTTKKSKVTEAKKAEATEAESKRTTATVMEEMATKEEEPKKPKEVIKMAEQTNDSTARVNRLNEAKRRVKNHALVSLGPTLIPLPLIDFVALTGIQLNLARSLAKLYEIPFRKDIGKSIIISLLGGGAAVSLSPFLASVIKFIPIVGLAAGSISLGAFSFASTSAIGKVFLQHFESGGTFLDLDPEKVRAKYAEMFEEAKKTA
jgi:uncharacterized protein (DUF697 family)